MHFWGISQLKTFKNSYHINTKPVFPFLCADIEVRGNVLISHAFFLPTALLRANAIGVSVPSLQGIRDAAMSLAHLKRLIVAGRCQKVPWLAISIDCPGIETLRCLTEPIYTPFEYF